MSLEQKGNFFLLSSRDNWNELNDITKAQRPGSRKWEMTAAESNIAWKIDSPIQPSVPVMIYCLPYVVRTNHVYVPLLPASQI